MISIPNKRKKNGNYVKRAAFYYIAILLVPAYIVAKVFIMCV